MFGIKHSQLLIIILSGLLLAACGGGGGGGAGTGPGVAAPAAPALVFTPQSIKTFHFSWQDLSDETEYRLLEDPDSVSGYTQVASISALSGAVYVFVRSGSFWSQQAYIKASNTGTADLFGFSVALADDGNTLAAGAIGEASNAIGINANLNDNTAVSSGAVYLY